MFRKQVGKDEAKASYSFATLLPLKHSPRPLSCNKQGAGAVSFNEHFHYSPASIQYVIEPEFNGCFYQQKNAAVPEMEANHVLTPL